MLQYLREHGKHVAIVINKWDLLTPDQQETLKVKFPGNCREIFPQVSMFTVSATNDDPMVQLKEFIANTSNHGSFLNIDKALLNARKLVVEKVQEIEKKKTELMKSMVFLDRISESMVVAKKNISYNVDMKLQDIKHLCKTLQENMLAFNVGDPKRCRNGFRQLVADVLCHLFSRLFASLLKIWLRTWSIRMAKSIMPFTDRTFPD